MMPKYDPIGWEVYSQMTMVLLQKLIRFTQLDLIW